jgi:hypothetical protein
MPRVTTGIHSGKGTSKLPELVPHPFEYFNKICSKQKKQTNKQTKKKKPVNMT